MSPPKKPKKNLRKSQIVRFRVTSACQKCKEKKTKCEDEVPCKNCRSHGYECIPVQATKRGPTPKKNKDRSGPDDPSSTSNPPKVPSEISGGGDCSSQPSENLEFIKLFEQLIDMDAGAGEVYPSPPPPPPSSSSPSSFSSSSPSSSSSSSSYDVLNENVFCPENMNNHIVQQYMMNIVPSPLPFTLNFFEVKPDSYLPEHYQPESDQLEPYQPESYQLEPYQSESDQFEPYQPESDQFEPYQSESDQFEPYQPESDQLEPYQSESYQSEPYQPGFYERTYFYPIVGEHFLLTPSFS